MPERPTPILALVIALQTALASAQEPEPWPSLHAAELAAHADDPPRAEAVEPTTPEVKPQDGASRPCKTIFGYLPYWESPANIRWDLLTHLACFSVEVNSTGTVTNPRGWPAAAPWNTAIPAARAHDVKVILVATNFTPSSIYTLITTPAYKQAFFQNIKLQVLAGGADGLNIDFEGPNSPTWRAHINGFMADLTAYMHAEVPGCEVSFAGPALKTGWDLPGLAASCDYIFIMGYAFYGSWSTTSGPCAPMTGPSINITNTLDVQYAAVTRDHPEKLILGCPYYGGHWTTQTPEAYSPKVSWIGSTRYRDDYATSQTRELLWDQVSQTPWYRWHDGTNWHQVWFDDAASLGMKWQLAQDRNLKGVGMWALNYDGALPYLWDELDRRFQAGCPPPAPVDFDRDGDVDREDLNTFLDCLSGPAIPRTEEAPACEQSDLDADNDVDQADFAAFQRCYSGHNRPADAACSS